MLSRYNADGLRIIRTARSDMDVHRFRNFAREALEKHLPDHRRGGLADFLNRLTYQTLDVVNPQLLAPDSDCPFQV